VFQKPAAKLSQNKSSDTLRSAFVVKSGQVFGQNPPAGANSGRKITLSRANAQIMESGGQKM
jgi:hypothetical protein